MNAEKTVSSFNSSCNCGKRPGLLLCGDHHDLKLLPEMSEWSLGCWGRGWSRPQRMHSVGRLFPFLVLDHAAASAQALTASSAVECPYEGSTEPPWPEHNCTVQPKQGEASRRSAYGFVPSLCWEHACKLCSLSLFLAGSWICIPQAEAKLLCAVHCVAASPGETKKGNKKS